MDKKSCDRLSEITPTLHIKHVSKLQREADFLILQYSYSTREILAFGWISLALRGSGAFSGGERKEKKIGVPPAPQMILKT